MDWPDLAEQDFELYRGRESAARIGFVPHGEGNGKFSQQPGRRGARLDLREGLMEVEMKIRGLMMDPVTNMPIVVLKDVTSDVVLPIWVGVYEANAIALEIAKVTTPRPMTYDVIKDLLVGLDTHVHKVVVNEL